MNYEYQNDKPPERLWLQWYEAESGLNADLLVAHPDERTYHNGRVFEHDIEYVSADAYNALAATIARHERTIERMSAEAVDLIQARDELEQEANELSANAALALGTQRADNERMIAAAERADVLYAGCDTPEMLADEVVMLRAQLAGGWTSVKDALPSLDIDRLCFCVDDYNYSRWYEIARFERNCFFGNDGLSVMGNVTHWRELPEPPAIITTGTE